MQPRAWVVVAIVLSLVRLAAGVQLPQSPTAGGNTGERALAVESPRSSELFSWRDALARQGAWAVKLLQEKLADGAPPVKNKIVAMVLELLGLGLLGVDRFYMGGAKNIVLGVLKLLSCGCCGLWCVIDAIGMTVNAISRSPEIHVLGFDATWSPDTVEPAHALGIVVMVLLIFVGLILLVSCAYGVFFTIAMAFGLWFLSLLRDACCPGLDLSHIDHAHVDLEAARERAAWSRQQSEESAACAEPPPERAPSFLGQLFGRLQSPEKQDS